MSDPDYTNVGYDNPKQVCSNCKNAEPPQCSWCKNSMYVRQFTVREVTALKYAYGSAVADGFIGTANTLKKMIEEHERDA